jgi:hypothetical protein
VDVTQITGLEFLALQWFSEIGQNLSCWATAANFVSWLALCPDHDISGGRVLWRGKRRAHNRAGQLFRMAAYSLERSLTPLGLPAQKESQDRAAGRTHRHGAQNCGDLLPYG